MCIVPQVLCMMVGLGASIAKQSVLLGGDRDRCPLKCPYCDAGTQHLQLPTPEPSLQAGSVPQLQRLLLTRLWAAAAGCYQVVAFACFVRVLCSVFVRLP